MSGDPRVKWQLLLRMVQVLLWQGHPLNGIGSLLGEGSMMQRCMVLLAWMFFCVGTIGMSSGLAAADSAVARGEFLFMNETFGGNGRTCATCHAPENFYTISPQYINTLPMSDSLFVYRENPDLMCSDGSRSCLEVDEMLKCLNSVGSHRYWALPIS